MAFIVKISVIFLLSIFLLSCSSHAHDHDLHEIRVGDRKLLALSAPSKVLNGFSRYVKESDKGLEALLKKINQHQQTNADNKVLRRLIYKGAEASQKLFAASGNKGLRVGWKALKWIYKVDKKCKQLEKVLQFKCDQEDSSKLTDIPGMSCVLSLAVNNRSVGCKEEMPTESSTAPCVYVGNGYYRKSGKVFRFTVNAVVNCPY